MSDATASGSAAPDQELDDDDLPCMSNEAAEIARLELPLETEAEQKARNERHEETIAKIEFHCSDCGMHEMVHYYGREPPFVEGIQYHENSYIMRDPFQAPPPFRQAKPEYFVAIGADCSVCSKMVCKDAACSFYYTRTYCLPCGKVKLSSWPVEAQAKLRKQIADKQAQQQS